MQQPVDEQGPSDDRSRQPPRAGSPLPRALLLASLAALATLVVFVWLALAARPAPRPTLPPLASYEPPSSLEPQPSGAQVLVGAGDIASCARDADEATA